MDSLKEAIAIMEFSLVLNKLKNLFFLVSNKCLLCIIVFTSLLISELYFAWVERLAGHCLLLYNAERAETGPIWELEHTKQTAKKQLVKIIDNTVLITHKPFSFPRFLINLLEKKSVVLSYEEFIQFYVNIGRKIFTPCFIRKLFSEQVWEHAFFRKNGNEIFIYLLDKNDIILAQGKINKNIISFLTTRNLSFRGKIDTLDDFKKNLHSPDDFFSAMLLLPDNIQRKIIPFPKELLNIGGELLCIGISDKVYSNNIEIGIEIKDIQGHFVIFFWGQTEAVKIVKAKLERQKKFLNTPKLYPNYMIGR